jgi:hypothetical protein
MAIRFIGMALIDQQLDYLNHFWDMIGGTRFHVGRQKAQGLHIFVKSATCSLCHLIDRLTGFVRSGDDLVLNIGDISDTRNPRKLMAQYAIEKIEYDERTRIANVSVVVNSRTTYVHAYVFGIERLKTLLPTRRRVVQLESQ